MFFLFDVLYSVRVDFRQQNLGLLRETTSGTGINTLSISFDDERDRGDVLPLFQKFGVWS